MEILRIENLNFTYLGRNEKALEELNLTINEGEFVTIFGQSGCGKTTLLRLLKNEVAPSGKQEGEVYCPLLSYQIGFIAQNPDSQIVTDKVWHEIAFGLENLNLDKETIKRRTAEMAGYFGITEWYERETDALSGGQKQLLNLASVLVMQPKLLLLDEPTAQLDPIAAADFIATLRKINRELGITVLIVEHRLEELLPISDRALYLENAKLLLDGEPKFVAAKLKDKPMEKALPGAARVFNLIGSEGDCPLTVREGKTFLQRAVGDRKLKSIPSKEQKNDGEIAIEANDLWFRYSRDEKDVLKGFDIKVAKQEIFCILGSNGAGKTTALNVLSGVDKAYKGKLNIFNKDIKQYKSNNLWRGNLAYLPQDCASVFIKTTLEEDFNALLKAFDVSEAERKQRIETISERLGITELLQFNPFDLSGGELQRCAFAKILFSNPKILLLDEPTKGLDAVSKTKLRELLYQLKSEGRTIVIVTHDIEFAAETADRCALFFNGSLIGSESPKYFFSGNYFYTTIASRISRDIFSDTILCEQVASAFKEIKNER